MRHILPSNLRRRHCHKCHNPLRFKSINGKIIHWSCAGGKSGGCGLFEIMIPMSEKEKAEIISLKRAVVNLAFSRRWRRRLRLQRKGLLGGNLNDRS